MIRDSVAYQWNRHKSKFSLEIEVIHQSDFKVHISDSDLSKSVSVIHISKSKSKFISAIQIEIQLSDSEIQISLNDSHRLFIRAISKFSLEIEIEVNLSDSESAFLHLKRTKKLFCGAIKARKVSADALYCVVFDPLDGSSSIDCGVSVGTIFGIYMVKDKENPTLDDVLQSGKNLLAAGYCMCGSSCMLVLSTGNGVNGFTLDPSIGEFILTHLDIKVPKKGKIYSTNEGNAQYWDEPTTKYVENSKFPKDGSSPKSLRYIGRLPRLEQGQTKIKNVPIAVTPEGFWCCPSPVVFQKLPKNQNPLNNPKPSPPIPKTSFQKKQTPLTKKKPTLIPSRPGLVSDEKRNPGSDTPVLNAPVVNERMPRPKVENFPRKVSIEFGELGTSDLKVVLLGKQGFAVRLSVHKNVLVEYSSFFADRLLEQPPGLPGLEIDDCEDVEIYVETVGLMYCKDLKQRLIKQNVSRVLRILKDKNYKLYEEVGEGVSATVHWALCIPLHEIVAIKVLDLEKCNNDLVIVASGAVKHEDLVEQVKKLFTKLSSDPTTTSELVAKGPAIFSGFCIKILWFFISLIFSFFPWI
ncbi:unnamed protein product [Camellia sinensis]